MLYAGYKFLALTKLDKKIKKALGTSYEMFA